MKLLPHLKWHFSLIPSKCGGNRNNKVSFKTPIPISQPYSCFTTYFIWAYSFRIVHIGGSENRNHLVLETKYKLLLQI